MAIVQLLINSCMIIYKITNNINNKWYIGKHNGTDPNYMGSGKLLRYAMKKYGINNFSKEILEECNSLIELNQLEKRWILETNAVNDPMSYNLASGGEGGDLNQFKDHDAEAYKRAKGWFVSKVNDPTEVYVHNISKWCDEHSISKAVPTRLNDPKHHLFQKQTNGWRIRRSDMPLLPPYTDRRTLGHENIACKGKTWKLENGTRVWYAK
jgi:hypothetical protein